MPRAIGAAIAAAGSAAATGLMGPDNAAIGLLMAAMGFEGKVDSAAMGPATGALRGFNAATGVLRREAGPVNAAIGLVAAASGLGSCAKTAEARKRVLETIRSIPVEISVKSDVISVMVTK